MSIGSAPTLPTPPAATPACRHLFVSTALEWWITDRTDAFARDVQIDDVAYRRLDAEYYAWLRSRMVVAKKAADTGQIETSAFEDLRLRFNVVHEWAVQCIGEEQLLRAVRAIRVGEYQPPIAEDDGARQTPQPARKSGAVHVPPEAFSLVDAIAETALALGWNRERLYCIGSGIFDPRRGLVCYLKLGDRLGEVTAQSIEIIHPLPAVVRHRFYNPDVEQPWIKKTRADPKNHENSMPPSGISG